MNRVKFYELPTNVRIVFIFIFFGLFSLLLYSFVVQMGISKGLVNTQLIFMNTGLYVLVLYYIKKKNIKSYIALMFILGPVSFYNVFSIAHLYLSGIEQKMLYVWWPMVHFFIFLLCFTVLANKKTFNFYK